jgi:hypothetical protein
MSDSPSFLNALSFLAAALFFREQKKQKSDISPLSIKQILNALQPSQDDGFQVDNVELHQIRIVGNCVRVEVSTTFTSYFIEDSTGEIEAKTWTEDGNDKLKSVPQPIEYVILLHI